MPIHASISPEVDATDLDNTAREWQTRAALWARDWKLAARSIAAMSEDNRSTARWRYWAARVAAHEGQPASARQMYESLLGEDNYYSAMAAARLKRKIAPNPQPLPADAALLSRFEAQPEFVRARELRVNGMLGPARAEWRAGASALPAAFRPQLIHLAARWGWYHQAVDSATGERVFNDYSLLYPRPYDDEVARAARLSGLPSTLIYSVIRQESLYEQRCRLRCRCARIDAARRWIPHAARRASGASRHQPPMGCSIPAVNVQWAPLI